MLILINPLVEISLQEVNLLCVLKKSWPELLLELLLPQNHLDILGSVINLALLLVDLSVELKLDMVVSLQGIRVAREGESLWLELKLQVGGLDIGYRDGQVDEVLSLIGLARSLSPKDCFRY